MIMSGQETEQQHISGKSKYEELFCELDKSTLFLEERITLLHYKLNPITEFKKLCNDKPNDVSSSDNCTMANDLLTQIERVSYMINRIDNLIDAIII